MAKDNFKEERVYLSVWVCRYESSWWSRHDFNWNHEPKTQQTKSRYFFKSRRLSLSGIHPPAKLYYEMVPSTVGQVFTCIKQWRLFLTQTTSTIYVSMFICTCVSICHEDLETRGQGEVLGQVTLSTVLHVYVCRVSSLDLELIKIG